MHTLHKVTESVPASDLPGVIQALVAEGHTVRIRPRGPHGAQFGDMPVRMAMVNPEPYDAKDRSGNVQRSYAALKSLVVVGLDRRVHYWPLHYPKGRAVTFRVYV